jgi:hypothetical protein
VKKFLKKNVRPNTRKNVNMRRSSIVKCPTKLNALTNMKWNANPFTKQHMKRRSNVKLLTKKSVNQVIIMRRNVQKLLKNPVNMLMFPKK